MSEEEIEGIVTLVFGLLEFLFVCCMYLFAYSRGRKDGAVSMKKTINELVDENEKLRGLIFFMLVDEERGQNDDNTFYEHERAAKEFGIEVDA